MLKNVNHKQRIDRVNILLGKTLIDARKKLKRDHCTEVQGFLEDFYQKYENYESSKGKVDIILGVINFLGITSVLSFIGFIIYLGAK